MKRIDKDKYKVVEMDSPKKAVNDSLREEFGVQYKEKRYMVVDGKTGEIVDNAQGWGFKSIKNAYTCLYHKLNRKELDDEKRTVKKWLEEHKTFKDRLEDMLWYAAKDGDKITEGMVLKLAEDLSVDVPFKTKRLLKYLD